MHDHIAFSQLRRTMALVATPFSLQSVYIGSSYITTSISRDRGIYSILYLGMAKETSNLPYWIMAKEATKPQTKHADRMILQFKKVLANLP